MREEEMAILHDEGVGGTVGEAVGGEFDVEIFLDSGLDFGEENFPDKGMDAGEGKEEGCEEDRRAAPTAGFSVLTHGRS
jgi:hypothetical protein